MSCKKDTENRLLASKKENKKKEVICFNIHAAWVFNVNVLKKNASKTSEEWKNWQLFLSDFTKVPKNDLRSLQKKSVELSKKVDYLSGTIPLEYDFPQIKSRIAALTTKVKMLDMYLHLRELQENKIMLLFPDINSQIVALQNQMNKIVIKSKIPLEEGESELRKMLDSSRAIPNVKPDPNLPRIE